jgi:molecular chaperone DnaK
MAAPPPFAAQAPAPPPPAFQSAPPQALQPPQAPGNATAAFGGFGGAPQHAPQPYASQPPPGQGFGAGPSQPPIFGAYQSAPPDAPLDVNAMGARADQHMQVSPGAPGMPQNIGYQAPVLVDVTPRGLVVETAGGYTDTIIPRNSKIPCERTRRFATGRDMQTTVRVRVGQGESPTLPQNTFLGEVELSGLRPAPRGEVVVAVTFEVDADGTLRIRARDVQTGQEARATLQLIGVADESSVVMMINRFAHQPVVGTETPRGPTH